MIKEQAFDVGDKVKITSIVSQSMNGAYLSPITYRRYAIGDIITITSLNGMYPHQTPMSSNNNYSGTDSKGNLYIRVFHGDIELAKPDMEQLEKDLAYFEKRVSEIKEEITRLEKYPDPDDEIVQLLEEATTLGIADLRREKFKKAIRLIRMGSD
jgi:hypothetical protein